MIAAARSWCGDTERFSAGCAERCQHSSVCVSFAQFRRQFVVITSSDEVGSLNNHSTAYILRRPVVRLAFTSVAILSLIVKTPT
jgi:hypothetical protein